MAENQNKKSDELWASKLLGLKGILQIAGIWDSIVKTWLFFVCITTTLIITLFSLITNIDVYKFLIEIKDQCLSFLPDILGFTIAGYALIVGFVQSKILKRITTNLGDSQYSYYQKTSSKFALNIICQAITLIVAFVFHFIAYLDTNSNVIFPKIVISAVNWLGFIILCNLFILSLLVTVQIVVNIFNFSQIHHYLIRKDRMEKSSNDQSDV